MYADLLTAVGLKPVYGLSTSRWLIQLRSSEALSLCTATNVPVEALEKMCLQHYSGRALRINPDGRTLSRGFPWGRARGSRFCPICLDETGGRWQLRWRLGWAFACTTHHCLLADACPKCLAVQRLRPHISEAIPRPGRCAHPDVRSTGRAPERCGANLTAASVPMLGADHPAIRAQEAIEAIIDAKTAEFGIYHRHPQPRANVLADIRAIAGRVLAYAGPSDLPLIIPADLLEALSSAVGKDSYGRYAPTRSGAKPGLAAPALAVKAAVGVLAAIEVLNQDDVATAGEQLRWLVTSSRNRGLAVSATNITWGKNTSPVLAGAQLTALSPYLKPSDQLRYRIGAALPNRPTPGTPRIELITRRLPTMLWPQWSLPLAIPVVHQRYLRPALSSSLLLVNTRASLAETTHMIDSPTDGHGLSRVLQLLEKSERWPGIRSSLTRMADYLADNEVPIDYSRRRRLDYSMLLPDTTWAQISRDTGTPGPRTVRARYARCLLFERLSGQSASKSSMFPDSNEFRTKAANFPRHLTPQSAAALDEYGRAFLAEQGVFDEPLDWRPPSAVLDGLDLPGPDPNAVDLDELHRVIRSDGIALGTAAQLLSTSIDTVRYLLGVRPAPLRNYDPGRAAAPGHNNAYALAKAELPRDKLIEYYRGQRMSLREIAATVGVSRQVIARLARDYDLALRQPGREAQNVVDRDWLYDQYVNKRCALPDIAEKAGMSTANLARWAKTHAIPMRGRGGVSHSSALAAERLSAQAPELIRPALAGIGGRERLQRFVAATRYPTLTVAAEKLGVGQAVLISQINRIERELGARLLDRAERGRPMQLTEAGSRVVATIRAWQPVRGT